jgi:hypothetical protein
MNTVVRWFSHCHSSFSDPGLIKLMSMVDAVRPMPRSLFACSGVSRMCMHDGKEKGEAVVLWQNTANGRNEVKQQTTHTHHSHSP